MADLIEILGTSFLTGSDERCDPKILGRSTDLARSSVELPGRDQSTSAASAVSCNSHECLPSDDNRSLLTTSRLNMLVKSRPVFDKSPHLALVNAYRGA